MEPIMTNEEAAVIAAARAFIAKAISRGRTQPRARVLAESGTYTERLEGLSADCLSFADVAQAELNLYNAVRAIDCAEEGREP